MSPAKPVRTRIREPREKESDAKRRKPGDFSVARRPAPGRKRLAFVSKTPGRTQLINFFSLGEGAFLVDLPGYGYAGVPGEVQRHWKMLVSEYITTRESLAAVVVVMDARHPLTPLDRQLIGWLHEA